MFQTNLIKKNNAVLLYTPLQFKNALPCTFYHLIVTIFLKVKDCYFIMCAIDKTETHKKILV